MSATNPTNRLHFPAKIYLILENESPDIIRWHSNNKAFRIMDHSRFEREIIPKYFRHNQMSSVQRQLNLYGFKCVSRGEDKGAFYHPKFQRGDWESAKSIRRCVSNTQFGLQHWAIPHDFGQKTYTDSMDVNCVTFTHDNVSCAPESVHSTNSVASLTSAAKKNDWQWPPAPVVEQHKSASQAILKAFSTCDVTDQLLSSSVSSMNTASVLTNRLYNVNEMQPSFVEAAAAVADPFRDQCVPNDNIDDLLFLCSDLDSFFEGCDATTAW